MPAMVWEWAAKLLKHTHTRSCSLSIGLFGKACLLSVFCLFQKTVRPVLEEFVQKRGGLCLGTASAICQPVTGIDWQLFSPLRLGGRGNAAGGGGICLALLWNCLSFQLSRQASFKQLNLQHLDSSPDSESARVILPQIQIREGLFMSPSPRTLLKAAFERGLLARSMGWHAQQRRPCVALSLGEGHSRPTKDGRKERAEILGHVIWGCGFGQWGWGAGGFS